jgi:hypothetical protein
MLPPAPTHCSECGLPLASHAAPCGPDPRQLPLPLPPRSPSAEQFAADAAAPFPWWMATTPSDVEARPTVTMRAAVGL